MLKLIGLELKKAKLGNYLFGIFIANLVILLFITLIDFETYEVTMQVMDTFIRATFTVFAAFLLSKLIIEEFKNKTVSVLFMYPISRAKMIAAKLVIVSVFTFMSIIFSNFFIKAAYTLVSQSYNITDETLTLSILRDGLPELILMAITASLVSLIPLYFGLRKYSVPTTIVSAILIVMVTSSNSGGGSLNDIIAIPISLAAIGLLIMYGTIRKISKLDIS